MSQPNYKLGRFNSLYLFSLPHDLLNDLRPRQIILPTAEDPVSTFEGSQSLEHIVEVDEEPQNHMFKCSLTGATFKDLESLREHYTTDWYRYNAKLKMQGKPTRVSEAEFDALMENLTESISGSDSSSSGDDETGLAKLLDKQNLLAAPEQEETDFNGLLQKQATVWFEAPHVSPDTQYGIQRAALLNKNEVDVLGQIKAMQLDPAKPRQWCLFMIGGGHFAGMVVSLTPAIVKYNKVAQRETVVIKQKTFHRYTTRRKQGGSQSANDGSKGKAASAGAQIRRYNEAALAVDVQQLLGEWKEDIEASEIIFLRSSKSNEKIFFDYKEAYLYKKDPRIRGFGFPTKRPTVNELLRAFTELTTLKISHLTAEQLEKLDSEYVATIKTDQPKPLPVSQPPKSHRHVPVLTKDEEIERDRWDRLIAMVTRGKVDVAKAFLDKYENDLGFVGDQPYGKLPSWLPDSKVYPTLLHVASHADQAEMVQFLLEDKRSNPTLGASLVQGTDGEKYAQTPYEVAPSRGTRNVFRLLTTKYPSWWNWTGNGVDGARIPSGLDEEKERERDAKNKERRNKLRDKIKSRTQKEEVVVEESKPTEIERIANTNQSKVRRLGGMLATRAPLENAGLTEEQKMRIMREQRARAAEARIANLKSSN